MVAHDLVDQDPAVVADDFTANAAVVELVTDAPAAAREVVVVSHQAVLVFVLAALPIHHPPTRRLPALESDAGYHVQPPFLPPSYAAAADLVKDLTTKPG